MYNRFAKRNSTALQIPLFRSSVKPNRKLTSPHFDCTNAHNQNFFHLLCKLWKRIFFPSPVAGYRLNAVAFDAAARARNCRAAVIYLRTHNNDINDAAQKMYCVILFCVRKQKWDFSIYLLCRRQHNGTTTSFVRPPHLLWNRHRWISWNSCYTFRDNSDAISLYTLIWFRMDLRCHFVETTHRYSFVVTISPDDSRNNICSFSFALRASTYKRKYVHRIKSIIIRQREYETETIPRNKKKKRMKKIVLVVVDSMRFLREYCVHCASSVYESPEYRKAWK